MPEIIPVIDLMRGEVVHARRGDRQAYQPLQSALVDGSAPFDVAQALIGFTGARHVYIADIDAIRGKGNHLPLIAELVARHPSVEWWVDGGFSEAAPALALHRATGATPVFGTETLRNYGALRRMRNAGINAVLSLDYRNGVPLGPDWAYEPSEWPARVIAMELARVGAESGPALPLIRTLQSLRADVNIIAAGGVRNAADLVALDALGVTAALVASALHDGARLG